MNIVALFSIDNNYDQPDHNLVRFWSKWPDLRQLSEALGVGLSNAPDDQIVALVKIMQGGEYDISDTSYRLAWVEEGKPVPKRT